MKFCKSRAVSKKRSRQLLLVVSSSAVTFVNARVQIPRETELKIKHQALNDGSILYYIYPLLLP